MDGAMGTELRRTGLPDDECSEGWNLTNPDRVRAIHQAYKNAGAQCFLTNTFQSNPTALAKHGLDGRLEEINRAAIEIARAVAAPNDFVLGDIGPFQQPWNEQTIRRIVSSLRGVDGVLLETFSDMDCLWAVKYGCLPGLEAEDIPVLLSITYKRSRKGVATTQGGQSPEVFARLARQYSVAALGVNCGREIELADVIQIICCYRGATELPLFARPNAGTPVRGDEGWVYPRSPQQMAAHLLELIEAGATLVGGCCGTTPEHIAAFRPIIDSWNEKQIPGQYI
jgi:5-methyltetrahydrofolate--homocysteine methyltransferase